MSLVLSLLIFLVSAHPLLAAPESDEPSEAVSEETTPPASVEPPKTPPAPESLPEPWYRTPTKNLFTLGLGLAIWPDLGSKEFGTAAGSSLPGRINSVGGALEVSYQRHIAHWEQGELYLGAEFGGFRFDNDNSVPGTDSSTGRPVKGMLDATAWYVGPSAKFMMGQGILKYFVGAGGGFYNVDITESEEVLPPACTSMGPCSKTNRSFHKGTIGGYISFGIDLAAIRTQGGWVWRFRLEDKIHLVNFGTLDTFSPDTGNLSGPINVLQFGVVTGF